MTCVGVITMCSINRLCVVTIAALAKLFVKPPFLLKEKGITQKELACRMDKLLRRSASG